ncbi:MFS transporter [Flexivirga oryzae]|uniref:NNP family nitrate/nitrite transporter-like MFS transporter n=1 Tax=Flexivirga oryzae TaxID=1794944 RepID=A0A839NHH7_9MICO|nr:nitrate/nitrite transporter [Flexivirga oryzae]MBB2894121.1 NNP family nitrate/nitrite transporter-like MFS transporter [Flexivirga oryzae]
MALATDLEAGGRRVAPGVIIGPGRWISGWNPEAPAQWEEFGRRTAQRNLALSVFTEFLGFGVFAIWSVVVPLLPKYGYTGASALSDPQQFWLISIPTLVGASLRIPYSFMVTRFGGRNWTVVSALLLLLPTIGLALAIGQHAGFPVLLAMATLAGVGGGNFASSMTNISFFYPAAEKGKALGINAAGGNLGTAAVQFAAPVIVTAGAGVSVGHPNVPVVGWVFVPLVVLAAIAAWLRMDNLAEARSEPGTYAAATRSRHTWILSFIYFGTFGSFIGFSGVFPKLMNDAFPGRGTYALLGVGMTMAFLGALVGSMSRPLGGIVADRVGGWRVTVGSFTAMALGAAGVAIALSAKSFGWFMVAFLWMFTWTGIGNGSIYRMIPAVFARSAGSSTREVAVARKVAAGAIGIVGAVGALGGFVIPQVFSLSKSATHGAAHPTGTIVPALWAILACYLLMAVVTWAVYGRKGSGTEPV